MVIGSIDQFRDKEAATRIILSGSSLPASDGQLTPPSWASRLLAKVDYSALGLLQVDCIRAGEIELWLRSLPLARSTCAKIRNVMSVLFNHGLRHELLDRNPVQWVRQSSKRKKIPAVLEIEEVHLLLRNLDMRERTTS